MQFFRAILAMVAATLCAVAQVPDLTPPTPLIAALLTNNNAEATRLLSEGADPNEGRFIGLTPLILSAMQGNLVLAKALVARGADLKATDSAGNTALMWSVASDTANPELAEALLQLGANAAIANKQGETALTWAMRRGHTPVVESLKRYGAPDAPMLRQSVEKALALLQTSGAEFVKVSGCASCHHQSLPQMAYAEARQHNFKVDFQFADKQAKSVVAMFRPYREQMLAGKQNLPDPAISVSYSLLGLAAERYSADDTTSAMAHLVSVQQRPDGSFAAFTVRPPLESSVISATSLSLRALQAYGNPTEEQIARAGEWLRKAEPRTTEDKTMRLLGLVWSKMPKRDIQAAGRALIAEQRADGGWAQLPMLDSDAYATGQALFALHSAGELAVTDKPYQQGLTFLLRTQRTDGSWLVRSRSVPFQPYKESGFPHGKDQWISASGTSWAVMALTQAIPAEILPSGGL